MGGDPAIYGKHLAFGFEELSDSGKTEIWSVSNVHDGNFIGQVRWHGPWRQYSFFQEPNVVMSSSCLREMADMLEKMNKKKAENVVSISEHL